MLLSDTVLILASSIIIVMLLVSNFRRDWLRLVLVLYAGLAACMFFVDNGGQVTAALAFGLIMYYVLAWINDRNNLGVYSEYISQQERVPIFEGIMTASANRNRSFNTYDPSTSTYRRLPRSINRIGGAQFSYSFWLMFERGVNDDMLKNATVFLRGDRSKYAPKMKLNGENTTQCYYNPEELGYDIDDCKDYTIVCPRVFFLSSDQIGVDINTDRKLRQRFVVGSNKYNSDVRKKALSLLPGHFALFTFVFEDNVGINDFEKGVRFTFYLNDQLYHTETCEGAIRQNSGYFHLLPDRDFPDCKLADMMYHNYALGDSDVSRIFNAGYSTQDALKSRVAFSNKDSRLMMSAYNKVDMYNFK